MEKISPKLIYFRKAYLNEDVEPIMFLYYIKDTASCHIQNQFIITITPCLNYICNKYGIYNKYEQI